MCTKTDTGSPGKQVRGPFVLARGAGVGSLGGPRAPCLLVPGCRSSLQKVLAEGVFFLTPLPQGFGFTSPGEPNNHIVTPKLEVSATSHALATTQCHSLSHSNTITHALTLYLNRLSSTTWKKTKQTTAKPTQLCATPVSQQGVSSQGQSWCKQDTGLGKEERHARPFLFVLSRAFRWLHPQAPCALSWEHYDQLRAWVLLPRDEHLCW